MIWNFDMSQAPRNETTKVLIAVQGSKKLRWCVWYKHKGRWSGLIGDEKPLAFFVPRHPETKLPQLPKGVF